VQGNKKAGRMILMFLFTWYPPLPEQNTPRMQDLHPGGAIRKCL